MKLRQFPGRERHHVALRTDEMLWQPIRPGVESKPLYRQEGFADSMRLERWAAGASLGSIPYPYGAELLVIEGAFGDECGAYGRGTWLRLPPGTALTPSTARGCTTYVKEGGFAYLRAG